MENLSSVACQEGGKSGHSLLVRSCSGSASVPSGTTAPTYRKPFFECRHLHEVANTAPSSGRMSLFDDVDPDSEEGRNAMMAALMDADPDTAAEISAAVSGSASMSAAIMAFLPSSLSGSTSSKSDMRPEDGAVLATS